MRSRVAVTLFELVIVLAVLVAFASLLVPLFSNTMHDANEVATERSLVQVRDALLDYWRDTKHVTLDGVTTVATNAGRLDIGWLFDSPVTGDPTFDFDVNTLIGWRGPYMVSSRGAIFISGSPVLIDAWRNKIVIQDVDPSAALRDVRVVSGGRDGAISIPASTATSALTTADVGDDRYVSLQLR